MEVYKSDIKQHIPKMPKFKKFNPRYIISPDGKKLYCVHPNYEEIEHESVLKNNK